MPRTSRIRRGGIWRTIIYEYQTDYTRRLPADKLAQLPLFLAEIYRGVSRRRLRLYPHVRQVLDVLRTRFPLAVVTDGQSAYARAELHKVGLLGYFDPIIVSGDHGYRKPDRRLFQAAATAWRSRPNTSCTSATTCTATSSGRGRPAWTPSCSTPIREQRSTWTAGPTTRSPISANS